MKINELCWLCSRYGFVTRPEVVRAAFNHPVYSAYSFFYICVLGKETNYEVNIKVSFFDLWGTMLLGIGASRIRLNNFVDKIYPSYLGNDKSYIVQRNVRKNVRRCLFSWSCKQQHPFSIFVLSMLAWYADMRDAFIIQNLPSKTNMPWLPNQLGIPTATRRREREREREREGGDERGGNYWRWFLTQTPTPTHHVVGRKR